MKRILSLLVVLLLAALAPHVLAAEPPAFTPFDHHILYTANGHDWIFEFPDITLFLPIEWEKTVSVEQTDDAIAFYHSASHDRYLERGISSGGFLFQLRASADESFRDLPAYEYLGWSETAGLHFFLLLPSDSPVWTGDGDIRAEYDRMLGQISVVLEKAQIRSSMFYYTEGVEWTDPGMS